MEDGEDEEGNAGGDKSKLELGIGAAAASDAVATAADAPHAVVSVRESTRGIGGVSAWMHQEELNGTVF